MQVLGPVVHEVFNTKPPSQLLFALLELLISTAGTGQISSLWCRAPPPATAARKHAGNSAETQEHSGNTGNNAESYRR